MSNVESKALETAIEIASGLAELINDDHETELSYLDVLDYFAIIGLSVGDSNPTEVYLAALGVNNE